MQAIQRHDKINVEFYCYECDHYTYAILDLNMRGNHVMNCPNCGHKHYRVVKDGIISETRFDESLPNKHEIIAMRSACVPSNKRRDMGLIARIREVEATGAHK